MRMTEINIGNEQITNGLKPIHMNKLNQFVLIAGKNGAGKSRLLSTITKILTQKPKKNMMHNVLMQIKLHEDNMVQIKESIKDLKMQQQSTPSEILTHQISQKENSLKNKSPRIEMLKEKFKNNENWQLIKTDYYYDNYDAVLFVPKKVIIKDSSNIGKQELNNLAREASHNIGTANMSDSTFAYIQVLQDRWFNARHPEITLLPEEKNKAIKEYEQLTETIRTFLDCKVDRDIEGQATIFGFQLAKSNLSDGQKIVLQYCIAIHAQGVPLDDHILIMDEPENHLHPSILIELIDKIKTYNQKGQIWIATHSVPLLAYFDSQDIWYMEDGLISKDGKVPENVLGSLLGNEEQIEKLSDFINLPAQQAVIRYAFEALFPQKAVNTGSTDPQTRQIHSAIMDYIKPDGKIKILDYGAGKGRILSGVGENKEAFLNQVEYYAFDVSPENKADCIYSISLLYKSPESRYFRNEKELRSKHDEQSFDIAIMCNVLHEIDPNDWLEIFGEKGLITKTLKNTGILLLVEDHLLPHGEKAYQNGFIVLDTPELKKMFCISSEETHFGCDDIRGDGRLKTHIIPQPYLGKLTSDTRKSALEELIKNAKHEISELRKNDQKNYKTGRLIAFWMHQMCNAELVLSKL